MQSSYHAYEGYQQARMLQYWTLQAATLCLILLLPIRSSCDISNILYSCLCSENCDSTAPLNQTIVTTDPTNGTLCHLNKFSKTDQERLNEKVENICFTGNSSIGGSQCIEPGSSTVFLFPGQLHTIRLFTASKCKDAHNQKNTSNGKKRCS